MSTRVIVPRTGYGSTEALVVEWLKSEGDTVEEGEPLVCVEAEKATIEVPAPVSGILARILVQEGGSVDIGQPVAIIADPGESLDSGVEADGESKDAPGDDVSGDQDAPQPPVDGSVISDDSTVAESSTESGVGGQARPRATPSAKRVAKEYGIDLRLVMGSWPEEVISRKDVLAYVGQMAEAEVQTNLAIEGHKDQLGLDRSGTQVQEEDQVIPLRGIRRVIAERMAYSWQTAARVTTVTEADVTELVALRERLRKDWPGRKPQKLSYTAFVARAIALALPEYPLINSSLAEDKIIVRKALNLGIAVSAGDDLVVPVVHGADRKDVCELSAAIERLAEKARAKQLKTEDLEGGTFTISNAGFFDVTVFTPMIKPPESAILGIGSILDKPGIVAGRIEPRKLVNLCLSYDHRVLDGSLAAGFLHRVKEFLQFPMSLIAS